jgi:hypothetical protein
LGGAGVFGKGKTLSSAYADHDLDARAGRVIAHLPELGGIV